MDEDVQQFMGVTGAADHVARGYLQISGGDPMQAIQLFFENPDLQASFGDPTSSAAPAQPSRPAPTTTTTSGSARNRNTGRQDAQGVIHLDSDDDTDPNISDDDIFMPDENTTDAQSVARNAQEEEDAAMARLLQEQMYSETQGSSADAVRAPIARRTETLAAPDPMWNLEDDRQSAVLDQLRRRQTSNRQPGPRNNPFSQSVWDDPDAPRASTGGPEGTETPASRRLAELFRPPHDLLCHLSWDAARDAGKEDKKWILVNLQDMSVFNCQALNRDHWKHENLRALIEEHFIFLQYEKGNPQADSYITFYFPNQSHENVDNYPHVSIIDPRTGEQVKVWSGMPFPGPDELHADLVEFLDRYSLHKNSKNPVVKQKPKAKPLDYGRMTEEEMMELALKQSLESSGGASGSNVHDPDELTKSNPDISGDKGKGKALATEGTQVDDLTGEAALPTNGESESTPFTRISSTNPHVEPGPDPATTRIQFRHSGGRVIRRFAVADPVRRIYEWLKAEPLEGKEAGVPFELKAMPAGKDLIGDLDATIDEAGLKMGTVMIEYIED